MSPDGQYGRRVSGWLPPVGRLFRLWLAPQKGRCLRSRLRRANRGEMTNWLVTSGNTSKPLADQGERSRRSCVAFYRTLSAVCPLVSPRRPPEC
jgi:hypothetical protein